MANPTITRITATVAGRSAPMYPFTGDSKVGIDMPRGGLPVNIAVDVANPDAARRGVTVGLSLADEAGLQVTGTAEFPTHQYVDLPAGSAKRVLMSFGIPPEAKAGYAYIVAKLYDGDTLDGSRIVQRLPASGWERVGIFTGDPADFFIVIGVTPKDDTAGTADALQRKAGDLARYTFASSFATSAGLELHSYEYNAGLECIVVLGNWTRPPAMGATFEAVAFVASVTALAWALAGLAAVIGAGLVLYGIMDYAKTGKITAGNVANGVTVGQDREATRQFTLGLIDGFRDSGMPEKDIPGAVAAVMNGMNSAMTPFTPLGTDLAGLGSGIGGIVTAVLVGALGLGALKVFMDSRR